MWHETDATCQHIPWPLYVDRGQYVLRSRVKVTVRPGLTFLCCSGGSLLLRWRRCCCRCCCSADRHHRRFTCTEEEEEKKMRRKCYISDDKVWGPRCVVRNGENAKPTSFIEGNYVEAGEKAQLVFSRKLHVCSAQRSGATANRSHAHVQGFWHEPRDELREIFGNFAILSVRLYTHSDGVAQGRKKNHFSCIEWNPPTYVSSQHRVDARQCLARDAISRGRALPFICPEKVS